MEAAVNTANSRPIVSGIAEETKTDRRLSAIRPRLRFSEALAQCKAEEDILSSLCASAGLPHGYLAVEKAWPWTRQRVEIPCGCEIVYPSALMILCHLYDRHVLDLAEWSMAELVEWGTRMENELSGRSVHENLVSSR